MSRNGFYSLRPTVRVVQVIRTVLFCHVSCGKLGIPHFKKRGWSFNRGEIGEYAPQPCDAGFQRGRGAWPRLGATSGN
jgi:hypothetical protein